MSYIQTPHRGSSSQHSRSISQYVVSGSDIEEMSDSSLVKHVNDLRNQIKLLTIENEILENVIMRVDPSLVHGIQQAVDYANKLQHGSSSLHVGSFIKSTTSRFGFGDSLASPSRLLASPSRVSTRRPESSPKTGGTIIFGTGPKINILERSELVTTEMELLIKKLERSRLETAKEQALLTAQLEEISHRVKDIEKATESFNNQVIIEGYDKIAQRIPAEVWIRYMNEWVKLSDKEIGKLRLRTSTLNTQFSKLKGQIKVKMELSESLRPVDFEKLEIENKVCHDKINSKKGVLVELKGMAGDANLNLTIHKKALMDQELYLQKVKREIEARKQHTAKLDRERILISSQADALQQNLDEIRKVRMAHEVPDIMEYVKVKSELGELKHQVKMLENRYHVQQIALKSLNRQLHLESLTNM